MLNTLYKTSPPLVKQWLLWSFKTMRKALYFSGHHRSGGKNIDKFGPFQRQRKYGPLKHVCYAPFTSMFFSREGYMSPCYATYSERSDRWPETSIHDAWFGGEFQNIRKAVADGDLNYACNFCRPLFDSGNYGSLLVNKYEPYGVGKISYPKIMEFELSNRCNLECVMCDGNLSSAIRQNREHQPPFQEVYDQRFLEELRPFIAHLQMAEFTGGDPFLIPIYYDLWAMINTLNPGCQILITTNGNTLSPRIENMLATYENLHFNISLDTLNREHYQQIRVNAAYDQVMANTLGFIEYCRKHKTSCNLLVCPTTLNSRDFRELIEFANQHDICVYFHTVIKPEALSLKYQSPHDLDELIQFMKAYQPSLHTPKERINAANYASLINLIQTWSDENKRQGQNKENYPAAMILDHFRKHLPNEDFKRMITILSEFAHHPKYNELLQNLYQAGPEELLALMKQETNARLTLRIHEMIETPA